MGNFWFYGLAIYIITVQKISASIAKITNPINISKIAPINLNVIGNEKRPIIPKSIPA
jgi:hypothetical protein